MRNLILKTVLLSAAGLALMAGTAQAGGDAEAGKLKTYTCKGCHGIPGYNNVYPTYKVPKIGGQNEKYLAIALHEYRDGIRKHPTMTSQAGSLSDQDIEDIAAYLASFGMHAAVPAKGDAGQVKAQVCAACHGPEGKSVDPSYPNLGGQHASYLIKSLGDYRAGRRNNPVMSPMAAPLSDQDIKDLAAWFSSQKGLRDLSGK